MSLGVPPWRDSEIEDPLSTFLKYTFQARFSFGGNIKESTFWLTLGVVHECSSFVLLMNVLLRVAFLDESPDVRKDLCVADDSSLTDICPISICGCQ